jgi:drug/metabolite transporter (DMT)-like permease
MNSMLFGLLPLLVIATWAAGSVLVERAWQQRAPGAEILATMLCVGFCLAAIAALAWAMPQPGQNWSDAPLSHIAPRGPSSLEGPATGR